MRVGLSTGGRGRVNAEVFFDNDEDEKRTYRLCFWNSITKRWVTIFEDPLVYDDFVCAHEAAKYNLEQFLLRNKGDLKKLEGPEHL